MPTAKGSNKKDIMGLEETLDRDARHGIEIFQQILQELRMIRTHIEVITGERISDKDIKR